MTKGEADKYKFRMFRIGNRKTFVVHEILDTNEGLKVIYKSIYNKYKKYSMSINDFIVIMEAQPSFVAYLLK